MSDDASANRPTPLAVRQEVFISSADMSKGDYLRPFGRSRYWEFKRDPRWPKPVVANGGKEIYAKAHVDAFLRLVAEEGLRQEALKPKRGPAYGGRMRSAASAKAKPTKAELPSARQRKAKPARSKRTSRRGEQRPAP